MARPQLCLVAAVLALSAAGPASAALTYRGVSYVTWSADTYSAPQSDTALADVAACGANCISLVATWYMQDHTSTVIAASSAQTPSDDSLRHAIGQAHALGLQVLLKPHVDLAVEPDSTKQWRGDIAPTDVAAWQESYRLFLLHYADLAAETGAELLCVGVELRSMTQAPYADYWAGLIAQVRARYGGKLTYAANWDDYDQVPFWGLLDLAGVDGYFPLSADATPTYGALLAAWNPIMDALQTWQATHGKPVLFTEVGYYSAGSCAAQPWVIPATGSAYDEAGQANAYAAALMAMQGRAWCTGAFWWHWDPFAAHPWAQPLTYTPQDKAAQDELAATYGGVSPPPGTDTSIFGFERSALRWVPQTLSSVQGISAVRPTRDRAFAGVGSLQLDCNLNANDAAHTAGEAFVDVRYLGFGETAAQDAMWNLRDREIVMRVWCPAGTAGPSATPNGLQIFLKNSDGRYCYGPWTNILENQWNELRITLSQPLPTGSSMSVGFDLRRIAIIGVKVGLGDSTGFKIGRAHV
jgi:hypothetical protein